MCIPPLTLLVYTLAGKAPPLRPSAQPGTTALASPPGFEAEYRALREHRAATGRPLVSLRQFEARTPAAARRLADRVNFDVPSTVLEATQTFFSHPTAQFIVAAFGLSTAARCQLGVFTVADPLAFLATSSFWMVQEWLIHDKLLHSEKDWFGKRVHRWHHELPYYHVSMDGLDLAAVWFAAVAFLLVGAGCLTATLGPCLTALAAYTLCGGVYEAAHYLAHTRVPLPPALNRMRRHHTFHHTLNDACWLAFTIPAIDRLFGTSPDPRDVLAARRNTAQRRTAQRRTSDAKMSVAQPLDTASPPNLREQVPGLLRMARLNTIPMGAGLVALGACGARHTAPHVEGGAPLAVLAARLTLSAVLTVLVTTGSMLINDYHDHKLGVDNAQTKPGRPLVTGAVLPDTVKLVLKWGYALHLTLLCVVPTMTMRLWVLANTLLTYLYSVHLKPLTGVKNFVCAAIVSMAVGLGAVAVGGSLHGLRSVVRPMAAVGGLIWHREIVMDIKDSDGDRLAGVKTLPVVFGAPRALLLSLVPLGCGTLAAATATPGTAALLAAAPLLLQAAFALRAYATGFEAADMTRAIEIAPLWLLLSLVALVM